MTCFKSYKVTRFCSSPLILMHSCIDEQSTKRHHTKTINEPCLSEKGRPRSYAKSPTARYLFWSILGLIDAPGNGDCYFMH